jgi:GrpB-like predicted nucleotidyltransferase (UPF0157 family)
MGMNRLVQSYNPQWPLAFERIRDVLTSALGDAIVAIEHVGSTSIPGMSAKPIIDLIVVSAKGRFDEIKTLLAKLGYAHEGNLGIEGREAFALLDKARRALLPAHHLYVCEQDSLELERHIAFRERLRCDKKAQAYYQKKKEMIAELCDHDRRMYAQVKTIVLEPFFAEILAGDG